MTAIESDRRSFLRAICENPADDVSRLVYADWLEENGEQRAAEFIRTQCAGELATIRLSSLTGIDWALGCEPHQCAMSAERGRAVATTLDNRRFVFTRGMISRIELPCMLFTRMAAALFADHPITEVRLTDKQPAETAMEDENEWGWYRSPQSPNAYQSLAHHVLPSAIWEAVDKLPDGVFQSWKYFVTTEFAHASVSTACVSYGRSLVGLPPLPTPHGVTM